MFELKFNYSYKNVYWTVFIGQQDGAIKIHNARYYAHAQVLNAYNCCLS